MRKILSLLLSLLLVVSLIAPIAALAESQPQSESTYPTTWDLATLYETPDAWQQDYDKAMDIIQKIPAFKGTLNNAERINEIFLLTHRSELTLTEARMYIYAYLGYALNPSDNSYTQLLSKLDLLFSEEGKLSAFIEPEIYALPIEQREAIFSDPLLEPFKYYFRDYLDPERQPLTEESNEVLAILGPAMGRASNIYDIADSVSLPVPVLELSDGETIELTDAAYSALVYGDNYDRDIKAKANETILTKYVGFQDTFAALLDASISEAWSMSQIYKFDTTMARQMHSSDVSPEIYPLLVDAAHDGALAFQRYLAAHKKGLGLEEQYPFDMANYASSFRPEEVSYDMAIEEVRQVLSVFGEEYLSVYDRLLTSGHVDVYSTDTKVPGAFEISVSDKSELPFLMFNFAGVPDDVSTLAHEVGHALYSYFAEQNQDLLFASPTIFTQEVASTTNELLYYDYKIKNAASEEEKLFYLESAISTFSGTFFYQVLYAEFEDALHKKVEAGERLDAEEVSDLWVSLYTQYRGDNIKTFPDFRYQWAGIPHFYSPYYVYQYATSVSYAASLCAGLSEGKEGAVEAYLDFLNLGASEPPAELLKVAGIDPLDPETYQKGMQYFDELVTEYERLVDKIVQNDATMEDTVSATE